MKFDLEIIIGTEDEGMSVRGVLHKRRGISTRLMRGIANGSGDVSVNGVQSRFKDKVKAGDVIGLNFPEESSHFTPQDIQIDVLYEDGDIIAVNKQPGLVVHPTKGHVDGTIANGLMSRMIERGERYKIRFVNRLDMDTSGALLIGKNSHAQSDFARQGDEGKIEKLYLAIVSGCPDEAEGVIDAPIALRAEGSPERCVRDDGAPSVTRYKVVEQFRQQDDIRYSLLELSLETGRTHQIRVHLAHIGCPVLGDALYGSPASGLICRQALHAASLKFKHPVTGEPVEIDAPVPNDMEECLDSLRVGHTVL